MSMFSNLKTFKWKVSDTCYLASNAFSSCYQLQSAEFTTLRIDGAMSAFDDCPNLTTINADNIEFMGSTLASVFGNCPQLQLDLSNHSSWMFSTGNMTNIDFNAFAIGSLGVIMPEISFEDEWDDGGGGWEDPDDPAGGGMGGSGMMQYYCTQSGYYININSNQLHIGYEIFNWNDTSSSPHMYGNLFENTYSWDSQNVYNEDTKDYIFGSISGIALNSKINQNDLDHVTEVVVDTPIRITQPDFSNLISQLTNVEQDEANWESTITNYNLLHF